ncbi:MAG: glycosyltransferase family 1 protein [Pseudomonadota bacterium]
MTRVVLDISRLISRVRHPRPSGVDRVEMAYARGLGERYGEALSFAAVHPTGVYGRLDHVTAHAYLDHLDERWSDPHTATGERSIPAVLPWMRRLVPTRTGVGSSDVLVQVSPHHLDQKDKLKRILEREDARFVCMIHDLIPIEYPEYARPGGAGTHEARMESVAELADAVIANSAATGASFTRWAKQREVKAPPVHVALLGTQRLPTASPSPDYSGTPYFVCLGTIEPRKNHLLLLHQWRHMAQTLPPDRIPLLKVIGRRGWENEQIVDMLERSSALAPYVTEINNCSDDELATILRGARGLLMPSFAEGYGMPIAEALDAGAPVIASDIAAHREAGGKVPEFLNPLDGPRWQEVILDYAADGPLRQAQCDRLQEWRSPDWEAHLEIAQSVIQSVAR